MIAGSSGQFRLGIVCVVSPFISSLIALIDPEQESSPLAPSKLAGV